MCRPGPPALPVALGRANGRRDRVRTQGPGLRCRAPRRRRGHAEPEGRPQDGACGPLRGARRRGGDRVWSAGATGSGPPGRSCGGCSGSPGGAPALHGVARLRRALAARSLLRIDRGFWISASTCALQVSSPVNRTSTRWPTSHLSRMSTKMSGSSKFGSRLTWCTPFDPGPFVEFGECPPGLHSRDRAVPPLGRDVCFERLADRVAHRSPLSLLRLN